MLVAAIAQARQATFDVAHPLPATGLAWAARRQERQERGELEEGPGQCAPRHLQVFIDDWTGCALDDPVPCPAELSHIQIEPIATTSTGGRFPRADARVLVHARILIAVLREVGLSEAGPKTVVGDS